MKIFSKQQNATYQFLPKRASFDVVRWCGKGLQAQQWNTIQGLNRTTKVEIKKPKIAFWLLVKILRCKTARKMIIICCCGDRMLTVAAEKILHLINFV